MPVNSLKTDQHPAVRYAVELIRRASITPDDAGCQDYLESQLTPLGFSRQPINEGGVSNSIFLRPGERDGTLAFAGHTDVVPVGREEMWQHPPFSAAIVEDVLWGRGTQDMKAAIGCWIAAVQWLVDNGTPLPTLQLLITSDEEGDSIDGTIHMVTSMQQQGSLPDAAIVGEPSCAQHVGDVIRRGRRGVVQARIEIIGQQGHSAYPQDADNAIHRAAGIIQRINDIDWGTPAEGFPPTTCQITNIESGTGAMNVIPGHAFLSMDIRYNPSVDFASIKEKILCACENAEIDIQWDHSAESFSTPNGPFLDLVCASILRVTGIETLRDTGGGTSDGRFLAAAGVPVAELGLTNSTIHQVNERVALHELVTLTSIYTDIIQHFEV